ncbi:hypothetical protein [Microcoleus sp. bin38.metabat.b11b12b14.051]|nr:hypothetical protein [Microcoleus sp. bin38.metabat.b11b12b14.051]
MRRTKNLQIIATISERRTATAKIDSRVRRHQKSANNSDNLGATHRT